MEYMNTYTQSHHVMIQNHYFPQTIVYSWLMDGGVVCSPSSSQSV